MKQPSQKRAYNKLAKILKRERKNAKPAAPKVTYKHIVQVHPVELGAPNLSKVVAENEFDNQADADQWIEVYNLNPKQDRHGYPTKAVYFGRVNDATGELE